MGNLIGKIKEKGLRKSIRMVSVKLKKLEKQDAKQISEEKRSAVRKIMGRDPRTVIIFENHFGYDNIMLQRPQHITRELSDDETLVLYNSYYDIDYRNRRRIRRIKDNCYVLDMYYYREAVLEALHGKSCEKFLMVYSTDTVPMSRIQQYREEGFKVLYEYVDDINRDLIPLQKLSMAIERHDRLIGDAQTFVVSTATRLYENVKNKNPDAKAALISNGVECRRFQGSEVTEDEEYLSWFKEDCIKVGYYGALASWVDYEILRNLADDGRMQIILLGALHDGSLEKSGLLEYENVRYFGKKPYERLPGYASAFDVCVIPFVVNEITKAVSPVKLFEYMAMGKPVVTSPLPECRKYGVVQVAKDVETFREEVLKAYGRRGNRAYIEELKECAAANDWSKKAKEMKCFMIERDVE